MNKNPDHTADKMSDEKLEAALKPFSEKMRRLSMLAAVSIVMAAAGLLGFVVLSAKPAMAVFAVFLLLALIFAVSSAKARKRYDRIFTEQMGGEIEAIVSSYFGPRQDAAGESQKDLADRIRADLKSIPLENGWNESAVNSYRRGVWKDASFEAFNARLEFVETTTDANEDATTSTDRTTVFEGIVIVSARKAAPAVPVLIRTKAPGEAADAYWSFQTFDEDFNRRFLVHSDESAAAYRFLDQKRMEQIKTLETLSGGKIGICISGNKLIAALDGEHRFQDLGGTGAAHIADVRENLYASMNFMAEVLDCLI